MNYQTQQIRRVRYKRKKQFGLRYAFIGFFALCFILIACAKINENNLNDVNIINLNSVNNAKHTFPDNKDATQIKLEQLLEKNEETYDFVVNYMERDKYLKRNIKINKNDLSSDVPLFMQWDLRWGYDEYGTDNIGLSGCGPVCLSMAYVYLTGNTDMNPRETAKFSTENGFSTEVGTSWSLMTEGANNLGLNGMEIPLSEDRMKSELDQGAVIILSMSPGDFTTTGHFILIRAYDDRGFYVNDPNSRENSEKVWDYDTLQAQIKCLWAITK